MARVFSWSLGRDRRRQRESSENYATGKIRVISLRGGNQGIEMGDGSNLGKKCATHHCPSLQKQPPALFCEHQPKAGVWKTGLIYLLPDPPEEVKLVTN